MRTQIIAHRGLSARFPENTMPAFQGAVELGCDGIELDVQLSSDGIPVVIHDENLYRTTGRRGLVKDFTYRELRQFDAGAGFDAQQGACQILSLEEYFAYICSYDMVTDIELKNGIFRYEGIEQKVADLIRAFDLQNRVLFSSFNHQSMVLCKKLLPDVPCGLLTSCCLVDAGAYVRRCGVEYLNPHYPFLTPENRNELQQHGVGVFAWTVDDPAAAKRLIELEIAGVISNHPELLLPGKNGGKSEEDCG